MAEAKDDAGGRALELGKDQGGCAQSGCHWAAERNGYCWAHQAAPTAESGKDFTRRVPSDSGNQSELGDQRVYEHRGPGCAGTGALFGGAKESGQDEAHELVESALVGGRSDPQTSALGVAAGETAHYDSAPVAEAPEWVTHERACDLCWQVGPENHAARTLLLTYITQRKQAESDAAGAREALTDVARSAQWRLKQSEREVASLQMRMARALGMVYEADGHNDEPASWELLVDGAEALRSQYGKQIDQTESLCTHLTDANLKAEGLRVDNEELKAKLAESERKLGEAKVRLRELVKASMTMPYKDACGELWGKLPTLFTSTEPAVVEAGKADPAPTETEALARFRVGQRVRDKRGGPPIEVLAVEPQNGRLLVRCDDGDFWYSLSIVEPADPAPPKPGADTLTKLVAALQAIRGNYGGATHCFANDLIRELEGGGKS